MSEIEWSECSAVMRRFHRVLGLVVTWLYAYVRGDPLSLTDALGLSPPDGGCPPGLFLPNDELVRDAAIAALSLINPNQNEGNNIAPLTDNFAQVNDPAPINTKQFSTDFTTHGTAIRAQAEVVIARCRLLSHGEAMPRLWKTARINGQPNGWVRPHRPGRLGP
jgi:hypothetical protein